MSCCRVELIWGISTMRRREEIGAYPAGTTRETCRTVDILIANSATPRQVLGQSYGCRLARRNTTFSPTRLQGAM